MAAPQGLPSTMVSGPVPDGFLDDGINPLANPEKANEVASQIQDAGSDPGEAPKATPPADTIVTLPGGFVQPNGVIERTVELRELTGADEEELARGQSVKNVARFVSTLIRCGVKSIGGRPVEDPSLLDNLLMGDRNFLVLHIRRVTYGDTMDFTLTCPGCQNTFDVRYSLTDDVPIRTLDDPKDRVFDVTLRDGLRVARLSLPTGADQESILDRNLTNAEANTALIGRCLHSISGEDFILPSSAEEAARNLGIRDRETLLKEIADRQVGPRYEEVKQECPRCARDFPLVIDLLDLFRSA